MEKAAADLVPGDRVLNLFDVAHAVSSVHAVSPPRTTASKRTGEPVPVVVVALRAPDGRFSVPHWWAADRPVRVADG